MSCQDNVSRRTRGPQYGRFRRVPSFLPCCHTCRQRNTQVSRLNEFQPLRRSPHAGALRSGASVSGGCPCWEPGSLLGGLHLASRCLLCPLPSLPRPLHPASAPIRSSPRGVAPAIGTCPRRPRPSVPSHRSPRPTCSPSPSHLRPTTYLVPPRRVSETERRPCPPAAAHPSSQITSPVPLPTLPRPLRAFLLRRHARRVLRQVRTIEATDLPDELKRAAVRRLERTLEERLDRFTKSS